MKRSTPLTICAALALAACSGSGGGGLFGPTPTPTPSNVANTSLPYYLPLAAGNAWTFDDGESINDVGAGQLSCNGCPGQGISIEELDTQDSSGTYEGSLYFDKQNPGSGLVTNFVGTSTSPGTNLNYISTANYPDGLPIMNDNPSTGESWTDENGDTSTIGSTGQIVTLSNGEVAINVAADTFTAAGGATSFGWQFGQGLGFVTISTSGGSTTLTSFTVNTANSYGRAHRTFRGIRRMSASDLAIFRKLVKHRISL